jgi:hypothetical protein
MLVVNSVLYRYLLRHSVPPAEAVRLAELDPDWDEETRLEALAHALARTIPPGLSKAEIDALFAELHRLIDERGDEPGEETP